MATRTQTEERIQFSYEEKQRILKKSDDKCCHCGRKLTVSRSEYEKATIEHVIPLSKGGTNDDYNLVALCEDCNKKKANNVLMPVDYFYYLGKEHKEELVKQYKNYCEDVTWFSTHCYTREDLVQIDYSMPVNYFNDHKPKSKNKNYVLCPRVYAFAILKRCNDDDIEGVISYMESYYKKIGIERDAREFILDIYKKGCVYKLYKNDEIIAVIPMMITQLDRYDKFSDETKKYYSMAIYGIYTLYQKKHYKEAIINTFCYIFECLSHLNEYSGISCLVHIPKKDDYASSIIKLFKNTTNLGEDEYFYKYLSLATIDKYVDIDDDKLIHFASQGLERNMHLKPIEKFTENKNNKEKFFDTNVNLKKANKNLKKERNRIKIDEYDPEYYGFA